MITVKINNTDVTVPDGTMLLEAAELAGAYVPTLCNSDALEAFGACRVCIVDVQGRGPVASCHTAVAEGMVIETSNKRLSRIRKNIIELVVSEHPLDCLTCAANQRCELQTVASEVGLREVRYEAPHLEIPQVDDSHPFLTLDMEKCIKCARCVRVCDEVQGSFILGMEGRGPELRVIAGNDTGLAEAECASCGACAIECPVAAIVDKGTEHGGIPEKVVKTTCAYCGVGCSLDVHVLNDEVLRIEPTKEGSANRGHTCVKGRFAHEYARSKDRLRSPLVRDADGVFQEVSWDDTLDVIAKKLTEIRDRHGPDAFAKISSSRCSNEDNYLAQKFTRTVMNTNSIDNCSRVCHSPSALGLSRALGTGAGTNSFDDVEHTKCILLVGANPTEAHPVFGSRIKQAVLGGAKLIVLDPRRTELARLADVHIQLNPGSNVAVVNAMQKICLEERLFNREFIDKYTEGYDTFAAQTKEFDIAASCALGTVDEALLREAVRMYAASGTSMILWGLGVTEAAHGTKTVHGLINLGLLTGNIGRLGTGTNPIRGQNNVQGASDVGALPNVFSDYRLVTDPLARGEHREVWGVEPPNNKGLRIPDMFDAAIAGTLKALWITAEDVAQSDPNTEHVEAALNALDLLIVQEIFMTPTAELADIVLPGTTFLEKDGSFVNSDRRIQRIRKALQPLEGTIPDGDIYQEVALRMGTDLGFGTPPDPSKVMEELATLSPMWRGVSYDRLEAHGFLQWPCRNSDDPGTAIVHKEGQFLRGRALLYPTPWAPPAELPDDQYPLFLTTGRQLFHYNVGTQTRRSGVVKLTEADRERLRIHPKDARRMEIDNGEIVNVISRRGQVQVEAEITRVTKPGTVFMTFHFPESRTNRLLSSAADPETGCPEYKVSAVRVEKVSGSRDPKLPLRRR
jgi:formate dehydrogenase major subunit